MREVSTGARSPIGATPGASCIAGAAMRSADDGPALELEDNDGDMSEHGMLRR